MPEQPDEGAAHDGRPYVHPETLAQWRAWLAEHHDRDGGAWVYSWRSDAGESVGYDELVLEALAWGWIDSTAGTVDERRRRLWFSPRRRGSGWSRPNKVRIEQLLAEDRMQPAGQAVLDRAHADGSWTLLDDVEDLVVPADLAAALADRPGAREHWDSFPPSARKLMLTQIVTAKRAETRAARIAKFADAAARGERGG